MLKTHTWQQVALGASLCQVFDLMPHGGGPCVYLKVSGPTSGCQVRRERDRLVWLRGRIPIPEVLGYVEYAGRQYLLTTGIAGVPASDPSLGGNLPRLVSLLAEGLKLIHAVPFEHCPFDARLEVEVVRAHGRMVAGLADEEDFDPVRKGKTARELYDMLIETRPAREDLVFTHGDYCLPNVIINDGEISGFVDLGSAGVGDRYRDLALAARSIGGNLGLRWVRPFFQAYGIHDPDWARVEFYQLLDEFF
ncbi:MAG: aminoglycoside 3'-phosphotransferase [Bacillota bacterium]|nr:aminoglycoside 3'-phosphotransferase [Bacillota bacterium]MDI7250452.1 aminoglycoside 3'-phosphotransferase [Bacillota bacterium]